MNANTVGLFTYLGAVLRNRLLAQRELKESKAENLQEKQNKKKKKHLPSLLCSSRRQEENVAEFVVFST
jgi:hypothetical protein